MLTRHDLWNTATPSLRIASHSFASLRIASLPPSELCDAGWKLVLSINTVHGLLACHTPDDRRGLCAAPPVAYILPALNLLVPRFRRGCRGSFLPGALYVHCRCYPFARLFCRVQGPPSAASQPRSLDAVGIPVYCSTTTSALSSRRARVGPSGVFVSMRLKQE